MALERTAARAQSAWPTDAAASAARPVAWIHCKKYALVTLEQHGIVVQGVELGQHGVGLHPLGKL